MHEDEVEEVIEQKAAQIAVMSCEVQDNAIQAAIRNIVNRSIKKPKSKYEYNNERVRTFRYGVEALKTHIEEVTDTIEQTGGVANYKMLYEDESPYVRDYKYEIFNSVMFTLRTKFNFDMIRKLDFFGQLLGDDRVKELCKAMHRCPLVALDLSGNAISDEGICSLGEELKYLDCIQQLNLSDNRFTDVGAIAILCEEALPCSLVTIDLSKNSLGTKTAFYLGQIFQPKFRFLGDLPPQLSCLYLGGKFGRKGWGDDFIRVLVHLLCLPGARPLYRLNYPEAGMSADGLAAIASLLVISRTVQMVNIVGTPILNASEKLFLGYALRINKSLQIPLYVGKCGLSQRDREYLNTCQACQFAPDWGETAMIAFLVTKELTDCARLAYDAELELFNSWQKARPIPFRSEGAANNLNAKFFFQSLLSLLTNAGTVEPELRKGLEDCDRMSNSLARIELAVSACGGLGEIPARVHDDASSALSSMGPDPIEDCQRQCHNDDFTMNEAIAALERWFQTIGNVSSTHSSTVLPRLSLRKSTNTKPHHALSQEQEKCRSLDQTIMLTEDVYAHQLRYGESLERFVGFVHLKTAPFNRNLLRTTQDYANEDVITAMFPHLESLGVAAAFAHFMGVSWPDEEKRRINTEAQNREQLSRSAKVRELLERKQNSKRRRSIYVLKRIAEQKLALDPPAIPRAFPRRLQPLRDPDSIMSSVDSFTA